MTGKPLAPLRAYLARLRRSRSTTRLVGGTLAVLLSLVAVVLVLFLLDWQFHFSRTERIGLLSAGAGVTAWAVWRWFRPAWFCRESEMQLALWIEGAFPAFRGQLADPLQFAAVENGTWGSRSLERAIVARAPAPREIPRLPDPQARRFRRLVPMALIAVAAIVLLVNVRPAECRIFAQRMLLQSINYPTRTIIARIAVNGRDVATESAGSSAVRVPVGMPLNFVVECRGSVPAAGTIVLQSKETAQQATLTLAPGAGEPSLATPPATTLPPPSTDPNPPGSGGRTFAATGTRLVEDLQFEVRMGDARIGPIAIEVVPLPVISVDIVATPPDYAKRLGGLRASGAPPVISVFQGSRVAITVQSANKALRSVELRAGGQTLSLAAAGGNDRRWQLAPTGTPLDQVLEPMAYEIYVVDEDDLSLSEPLRGTIGVKRDETPHVALAAVTLHVLPNAEPSVAWGVTDDYEVDNVQLLWQVTGGSGAREGSITVFDAKGSPAQASVRGTERLKLAPLAVAAGDEIRLTLSATDRRGKLSGGEVKSDPVVLHVTDEAGILSSLAEADQKSATELDELIERELQSGDRP